MPKLKLTYFDFDGGRGESIRLAMAIGNIPFEDHRIPAPDWPAARDQTPFRALPLLEVDGEVVTQSNAIKRYVGKLAGLYPEDPFQALRCDEVMDAVEDIVTRLVTTFGLSGDELREAREALVDGHISLYLSTLQRILEAQGGEFFADGRLTIADLKVFVWTRSLRAGILDHVPANLVERIAPKLSEHCDRVAAHPGVVAYYAGR